MIGAVTSTVKSIFNSNPFRAPSDAALFHVTHWKAGSQWMRGVLTDAFGKENIVEPMEFGQHLTREITPGKVYPCSYITKQEFDLLAIPKGTRRMVVIRDLRDTLVSWY